MAGGCSAFCSAYRMGWFYMPYLNSILQEKQFFFEERKFVESGVNLQMSEKITRKGNDLSFELAGFSTNRDSIVRCDVKFCCTF